MITLVGATGGIGNVVARKLLASGQKIRAISRSANRVAPLVALGAEPVIIDSILNEEAMVRAFRGSDAAYTMVPPTSENVSYASAAAVLARASTTAGLTHVVNLSASGAHKLDARGHSGDYVVLEAAFDRMPDLNVLHLRPSFFMTSFYAWINPILARGEVRGLLKGDLPVPRIASSDIGDIGADALIRRDFTGKSSRELLGQRDLSMDEAAAIIGAAIGNPDLRYKQVSELEWYETLTARGVSPIGAQHMIEMYVEWNDGAARSAEHRSPNNTTPTAFETFVALDFMPRYDAAKRAAA
jgi:uncharacterized protein YbjT (DUF2867 family)